MARADMSYLERNGTALRVRVRVSKKALPVIGKQFLKESLGHGSLARAQIEKHAVIAKLKRQIKDAEREAARRAGADPLELEAMDMRERLKEDEREIEKARKAIMALPRAQHERLEAAEISYEERFAVTLSDLVGDRCYEIEDKHGEAAAMAYADIAYGRATPMRTLLENCLNASDHGPKFKGLTRRAVGRLEEWCGKSETPRTIEAITPMVAAQFEDEALSRDHMQAATFQSYRSALSGYWEWLQGRGVAAVNPWKGRKARRAKPHRSEVALRKRPFNDDEVRTLLAGPEKPLHPLTMATRLHDVMLIAALSGMRLSETVGLRVKHVDLGDGCFVVAKGKTAAGVRRVPIHSALASVLERLLKGKPAQDAYLFADLSEPPEGVERSRASPLSKSFTRYRRKLGIDERAAMHPQSAVDFHSFRRWFIRKRVEALENGALGFTAWTLADVVGHDREDGPLAMTMGRYPGEASLATKRACVEAAGLP